MAKLDTMIALSISGVVLTLAGAGCEGEESSSPPPHATPTTSVISGSAQQGSMTGSTVQVSPSIPRRVPMRRTWPVPQLIPTAPSRSHLILRQDPLRIVVSQGSFLSEADGATISSPDPISVLLPSAPGGPVTANVNPLTEFIDQMAVVNIAYLYQNLRPL
jgi:hypothetical protein